MSGLRGDIAMADSKQNGTKPMNDRHGERTRRASVDRRSGEVHGSGSGAGGGGNPREDYDSDPMGGGGAEPQGGPRTIDKALRTPEGKDRGGAA